MPFMKPLFQNLKSIQLELESLDRDLIDVDGKQLKPSQCYHFEVDPLHLLFNTNCPSRLREKINAIVTRYIPEYEAGLQR